MVRKRNALPGATISEVPFAVPWLPEAPLLLRVIVSHLLVPAVTLTGNATCPTPPPVTMLDLPPALALAAAVAVLPVLVAAVVMIRRPDPAAELRASQA